MEARDISSSSIKGIPKSPDRRNAPDELRSVVEQRFMRMNEAHDRIRVETLHANHDEKGVTEK